MALDFPASPSVGQKYPVTPVVGLPQYTWDGEKWTTIGGASASSGASVAVPLAPTDPGVPGTSNFWAREDHRHPTNKATAAEYLANSAPDKALTPGAIWAAAVPVTLVDAATVTPNLSLGSDFIWAISVAGRTLANPTNGKPGQKGVIYIGLVGGGTLTTWGSAYKFPLGVKPSIAGGANFISYVVAADGLTMYCTGSVQFA